MTIERNTFAVGATLQGQGVTTANSGGPSDTAWTAIGGGPWLYATKNGKYCIQYAPAGISTATMVGTHAALQTKIERRAIFDNSVAFTSDHIFMNESYGTVAGTSVGVSWSLYWSSGTGYKLRLKHDKNASTVLWTGVHTYDPTIKYRVQVNAEVGAAAASGTLRVRLWNDTTGVLLDDTASTGTLAMALTGLDLCGANGGFTARRHGKVSGDNYTGTMTLYDVKSGMGVDAVDGPDPINVAPVASPTGTSGQTVNLAANASDSDGTVTSYLWDVTAWPSGATKPTVLNATAANASFAWTVAGAYTVSLVVTDDQGASATNTLNLTTSATATIPDELVFDGTTWS